MADRVRPITLVVVAGTGTEVGKTWVARGLAERLVDAGLIVAARKSAQSFEPSDATTDAAELAAGTGESPETVCPPHRWYRTPMAPPMAADALGAPPIALGDLVGEITGSWSGRAPDVGLVELAGGLRSPMAHDGDGLTLTTALDPDLVLLVADAGLGTINSVCLSLDALGDRRTVVLLNRFDPNERLHVLNREWLGRLTSSVVVTSVDELADHLQEAVLPRFCISCGRHSSDCDGTCAGPLEAPHHCPICARKLVVTIVPTGVSARCKVHGPLDLVNTSGAGSRTGR
jgi:dethiobiotin synthetase